MTSKSFSITGGDANVRVTLTENAGDIDVKIEVLDTHTNIGDLRGLFFNANDDALVPGLSVTGADITAQQISANSVTDLGGDVNINGDVFNAVGAFDAGVAFGTSGIGADDIRSTTFTIEHATQNLDLSDFDGQPFAVRLTSVGEEGSGRSGSLKLFDYLDCDMDPGDDEMMCEDIWVTEVPCNFADEDGFEVVWKYNGGSDKLQLEVEIPIEAIFGEDIDKFSFDDVDITDIEALFAGLGAGAIDEVKIDIDDDKIRLRLIEEDIVLTEAQVNALPTDIDFRVGVLDCNGDKKWIDICSEVDDIKMRSPIAFDLNRDDKIGVTGPSTAEVRAPANQTPGDTVFFDIDADGTLESIEWLLGDGDGFLIDNADGNAATDMDGARLFGTAGGFANGFDKLATWDTDANGRLEGAELAGLALWVDDGDAFVEDFEIRELADYHIDFINVAGAVMTNADGEDLLRGTVQLEPGPLDWPLYDAPDLSIAGATLRDATLAYGQKIKIDYAVQNTGMQGADSVKTTFYWSADNVFDGGDTQIAVDKNGDVKKDELDDNEFKSIKYSKVEALGDGFIFAVVDADAAHDEQDEDNNVSAAMAIDVAEAADLKILSFTARDTTLEDGQKLKLDLSVANSGETHAKKVVTTFYWSSDNALDALDVELGTDGHGKLRAGEIDSNERARIAYDDLAVLGDGYVFAVIDAIGAHAETDELNNESSGIFIDLL